MRWHRVCSKALAVSIQPHDGFNGDVTTLLQGHIQQPRDTMEIMESGNLHPIDAGSLIVVDLKRRRHMETGESSRPHMQEPPSIKQSVLSPWGPMDGPTTPNESKS